METSMASSILASIAARVFDVAVSRRVPRELLVQTLRRERVSLTEEARVPISWLYDCFAICLRQTQDASFPIQVATHIALEDYSVLGFALMTSENTSVALERLSRFGSFITDSGSWRMRRDQKRQLVHIDWLRSGTRTLGHRAANECAIAEVINGLRRVLGPQLMVRAVRFHHAQPGDTKAHEHFFATSIEWNAELDGIDLAAEVESLVPLTRNPAMSRFFRGVLEQGALAHESMAGQVRELVAYQLPSGVPSLEQVARRLAIPERTLRRKLSDEGVSYRGLLEEFRRTAALEFLKSGRSVTDVAFLLGFSETSALSRAFRRWHGISPRAAQKRKLSSARKYLHR